MQFAMHPIVEEAAAGSESAWHKIVETLGPAVRGFAAARGVREPEDVTQEVFLDAARNIGSFEGDWQSFRSWVFTIAYRRVADSHRARTRQPQTVAISAGHEHISVADSPEANAIASEVSGELLKAIGNLNEVERDVVLLRIIAELDSDEVAAIVGKEPGNVRVIQNRALKKLRRNLRRNV